MGGQKEPQQRTLFHEVMTIVAISSCFWGALFGALWWHSRQQQRRQGDERFTLKRLASRSMTPDRLPLSVIEELLEVNASGPSSVFAIQPEAARRRLLACPAIEQASVWRLLPSTIGVEYALRTPAASLAGLKNIGVDRCGTVFSLFPFYAPKRLPALVLPLPKVKTLAEVQRAFRLSKEAPIALRLLEKIQRAVGPHNIVVESLDLTHLSEHSVFRREAVVVLSSLFARDKRLYLRIGARTILSSLDRLPALCDALFKERFRSGMIDLRYEQMAILSGEVAS